MTILKVLSIMALFSSLFFIPFSADGQIPLPINGAYVVEWSPDGSFLALIGSNSIWLYSITDNMFEQLEIMPEDRPQDIAWSSDGLRLAVSNTRETGINAIYIWDIATRNRSIEILQPSVDYVIVSWSPDGTELATTWLNAIAIWNTSTGERLNFLEGHLVPYTAESVSWSPDGTKLASVGDDNTIKVWSVSTKLQLFATLNIDDGGETLEWSPNGNQLAVAVNNHVIIWESTGSNYQIINTLTQHSDIVLDVDWHNDKLATSGVDGIIYVWDTNSWISTHEIQVSSYIYSTSWSPDGTQLAYTSANNSSIQIVRISSFK